MSLIVNGIVNGIVNDIVNGIFNGIAHGIGTGNADDMAASHSGLTNCKSQARLLASSPRVVNPSTTAHQAHPFQTFPRRLHWWPPPVPSRLFSSYSFALNCLYNHPFCPRYRIP